jgi:hypothetical protein
MCTPDIARVRLTSRQANTPLFPQLSFHCRVRLTHCRIYYECCSMNSGFKQRAMEDRTSISTMLLPRALLTQLGQYGTLSFHEEAPNYVSSLAGTIG